MKKIIISSLIILNSIALFSCAKSNSKDDLKEAQLCLNTSTPSQARGCLAKIASDTSAAANKLRCSGVFISEGFNTPAAFTDALDKLNTPGACTTGCSSTVNALNSLSFHAGSNLTTDAVARQRNVDVASEAFSYCSTSGAGIYTQISSLFKIGTLASMAAYPLTGGATPTEDQIKTAIATLDDATIGTIATTTYASSCSDLTKASDATKKICADLATAVACGSTPAAVGACFKTRLAAP